MQRAHAFPFLAWVTTRYGHAEAVFVSPRSSIGMQTVVYKEGPTLAVEARWMQERRRVLTVPRDLCERSDVDRGGMTVIHFSRPDSWRFLDRGCAFDREVAWRCGVSDDCAPRVPHCVCFALAIYVAGFQNRCSSSPASRSSFDRDQDKEGRGNLSAAIFVVFDRCFLHIASDLWIARKPLIEVRMS